MASQWTIPKLVTWRVKDWASCFLACKIPLDEDGVVNNSGNSTNNNNLTFKSLKRKMKSTKKKRSERKLSLSPPGTRHHHLHLRSSSVSPTSASQTRRLSWQQPPVSDESGFIVFRFDREDGGFDVVKEDKKEKKGIDVSPDKSQRTVNRKLIYMDQDGEGTERNNSSETKETEQDHKDNTSNQETEDVFCDVHERTEEEEEQEGKAGEEGEEGEEDDESNVCVKSSGSNHSDEGRGSFAFPILGVEWMGSPVKMPESDDFSPKKVKPAALGFQCCKF